MTRLDEYALLGRSGLRVSPMALGTMSFDLGEDASAARRMVDLYADHGGNFIDTANAYGNGEAFLGEVLEGRRDRFVLSTKFGISRCAGDPNSGGAHRKALKRAVEDSLARLKTDHIDLYYLHIWDWRTPIEETLHAMNDLVREGKVLYLGISDTPAWKVAEANTYARAARLAPFAAYQGRYNLIDRSLERDVLPMAADHGIRVVTWNTLARGRLTGRAAAPSKTPASAPQQERTALIVREVVDVAKTLGATPSAVAFAWVSQRSGNPIPILGASKVEQLEESLEAAELSLPDDALARLSAVSAFDLGFPHDFAGSEMVAAGIDKGVNVSGGMRSDYGRWP